MKKNCQPLTDLPLKLDPSYIKYNVFHPLEYSSYRRRKLIMNIKM